MTPRPYLSVCMGVGGRYRPDLLDRLVESCTLNMALAKRFNLAAEWVVCDWGSTLPLPIYALLPEGVRVIHVPQAVHDALPNPHRLPYFEFQPKNVAIRRARGEYVLSTNPDDLWSDELAAYLASHPFRDDCFYRINRHDTRDGQVYRICYETGCFPPGMSPENPIDSRASRRGGLHFNAAGDWLLMHRDAWHAMHGHPEQPYSHTVDGQSVYLARCKGLPQVIIPHPLYHPDHPRTLNVNEYGTIIAPAWDDNNPVAVENGDGWGCAGMTFEETTT